MTHRPGHVDQASDGTQSMDRRKYLGTLAAGAALGTIAVGLAACGPGTPPATEGSPAGAPAAGATAANCVTKNQWGYLSIFPPGITTIPLARQNMPVAGAQMIKVPYFNSNGITIKEGDVVGFNLVRIGCPARFIVAYNLITEDDDNPSHADLVKMEARNTNMDTILRAAGYKEESWSPPDGQACPDPAEDWSQ